MRPGTKPTSRRHAVAADGAPASGPANVFTDTQLGSLSRLFTANDPQVGVTGAVSKHAEGKKTDRNVELLVKNPLD